MESQQPGWVTLMQNSPKLDKIVVLNLHSLTYIIRFVSLSFQNLLCYSYRLKLLHLLQIEFFTQKEYCKSLQKA